MRQLVYKALFFVALWLTSLAGVARSRCIAAGLVFGVACLQLTACTLTSQQRVLYDKAGIQVGLITDLSTNEHAAPPVINKHPTDLTPPEVRSLLGALEVSGLSGTIVGIFATPPQRPVFTQAELVMLGEPLAAAFHEATPRQRVFFAIQNPDALYETDRTSGSLFFRDDYLHVILTDHYAFLKADPGGGETRDPRDTKGMKLWVAGPARAATVPEAKEPHWNAFEKVHVSLKPVEILAGQRVLQAGAVSSRPEVAPAVGQPELQTSAAATNATESVNDLRLQIRELTSSNLELRGRLEEQAKRMEQINGQLEQLRFELNKAKSKQAPSRKAPTQ